MAAMPPENRRFEPAPLSWLPPLPQQRAGRAWESLRAAVRRRSMRLLGGDPAPASSLDLRLVGRLHLSVDGCRALFLFNEALRTEQPPELPALELSLASCIARISGATARAARRGVVHDFVLEHLGDLALEETEIAGELRIAFGTGPEGLWIELTDLAGVPLREADGAELELQFDGGPVITQPLRDGAALFRAGAALMEQRGLAGALVRFGELGRLDLEPSASGAPVRAEEL